MAQRYFATITPGLEEALLEEVRELGGKRASVHHGGVEFDATNGVFYSAALNLRCANRLWMRIDEFRARDAPELYNKTKRIDWARLIGPKLPVEVKAASHTSRLFHTGKVADTVRDGVNDGLKRDQPNTKTRAPITVLARLVDDRCQLSLDASGELHYRRGWKESAVTAPLRESVAAAVLRLSGWTPGTTLVDPFCGSGTIIVEASQRTAGIPAGHDREFALQRWANFRPELWKETLAEADAKRVTPTGTVAYGSDLEGDAIAAVRHNAERAGVMNWCAFGVADVAELEPPAGEAGFVVTNPPWDLRLDDPGNTSLDQFVERFRASFGGWKGAFIAPATWSTKLGTERASFELGGIAVKLWVL